MYFYCHESYVESGKEGHPGKYAAVDSAGFRERMQTDNGRLNISKENRIFTKICLHKMKQIDFQYLVTLVPCQE